MKYRPLINLIVFGCLGIGHSSDVYAGKGGSNGGDYLLLLRYANLVSSFDPIVNGVLPERNAEHYRYEFIRAARSGLRKMRSLFKSGRKFKYSNGSDVDFNERTLKDFSNRINELEDASDGQFVLVESLENERGEPLTARNFKSGRVEFVAKRWDEMRLRTKPEDGFNMQEAIATHEVLGIDEVEVSDEYPVASAVMTEPQNAEPVSELEKTIPPRCTGYSSLTFDLSMNFGHRIKKEPGKSHGIISSATYSCLGTTTELGMGLGNIFSDVNGKSIPIRTYFSSSIKSNDFIKNAARARQIYCAMSQIMNSTALKDVQLDPEDQYLDKKGEKVTTYSYDLLNDKDRQLVFGYYGFHQALAEAFQAEQNDDPKAKAAALYRANTAIGEGLLTLDEALRLKPTPTLFIKYSQKAYDHYVHVEYPKLLEDYKTKKAEYDEYLITGKHPDYGWITKSMEKLLRVGEGYLKPREPRAPKAPAGVALAELKACGYYNPKTEENKIENKIEIKTDQ